MATTTLTSLVVLTLVFAMAGSSAASYCVCKGGGDMQKAIDYACGNGGDCTAIRPNGACYNPNSLQSHCSYAVNSYYQKKSSTGATCDFGGVATLSSSPPSGMCSSSGSTSAPGSSSSPSMTTPSTSPSTSGSTTPVTPVSSGSGSTPTSGSSPYMTPGTGTGLGTGSPSSTGVMGGVGTGTGLAPSGVGMNDESRASGGPLPAFAFAVLSCSLAFLWC